MSHEHTIEIIYHFTCGKCKGWWSHAHTPNINKNDEFRVDLYWFVKNYGPSKLMFCPHCGEDGNVKIKKGFTGE